MCCIDDDDIDIGINQGFNTRFGIRACTDSGTDTQTTTAVFGGIWVIFSFGEVIDGDETF